MAGRTDLTFLWKALEAEAAQIDQLVAVLARPGVAPSLDDLSRTEKGKLCQTAASTPALKQLYSRQNTYPHWLTPSIAAIHDAP